MPQKQPCVLATAVLAVSLGLLAVAGCSSALPGIGDYRSSTEPGEPEPRTDFDDAEASITLDAMRSAGERPQDPPQLTTAARGRWTDVRAALAQACGQDGIDAAIVGRVTEDGGDTLRFRILTAEEWRGEVVVRRGDPVDWDAVRAESRLGTGVRHEARLAQIIEAFEEALLAYGRKRAWADVDS